MDQEQMEQQPATQQEAPQPLRTYYGDERRRLFAAPYDGIERRIPDPYTEQDEDRDPPPN